MEKVIYDLEQFPNFHSGIFYDFKNNITKTFVIHSSRDERVQYFNYLIDSQKKIGMIGFNNLGYDYPLLHYIIINHKSLLNKPVGECLQLMYDESQRIIADEKSGIPYWKVKIAQLDLFRMHHFNNKAKMTSLKHLQMAMHWENLQEMPFHYSHMVTSEEVSSVLEYNLNDVMSTYQFYIESLDMIRFRRRMNKMYGINCMNYPDVKIGEEILIIENAKALNIPIKDFKQLRTKRGVIALKDCILPNIKFKSKEFNNVFEQIKKQKIHALNTKNVFEKSVIYGGVKYDFGLGGIHGTCGPGVFRSDEEGDLILVDVDKLASSLKNPVNSVDA